MGKGRSKRRRERNAARAQAEKKLGMPVGPDEGKAKSRKRGRKGGGAGGGDDELSGLPRRMREMIRLKEFAEKQAEVDRASRITQEGTGHGSEEWRVASGSDGETENPQEVTVEKEENMTKRRRHVEDLTGVNEALQDMQNRSGAGGRKREKAKEWKKQKRLRQQEAKAPRLRGVGSDDGELQLPTATKVRFGETAEQPPEFNLKQRHWDPEQQAARCSGIFQKQLQEAATAARRHAKLPDVGSMHAQDAALRLQLIEGYRQQRRGSGGGGAARKGPATLQSLKKLVAASGGEPSPAQG